MLRLRLCLFLLAAAMPAAAQTTLVTGTVTDPNSVKYAGATLKAQLVFTSGSPVTGQPTVTVSSQAQCSAAGAGTAPCQVTFQGRAGPVTLDSTGSIPGGGMVLQDNTLVTPASTQWLFTVNSPGAPLPLGTGPQTFSIQVTISGATQSISGSLSAAAPALSNITGGGGSSAFSAISSGTNTTAAMLVGSGASLAEIGTGVIQIRMSSFVPAVSSNSVSNSAFLQTWRWALIADSTFALTVNESAASTGGTVGAAGLANQGLLSISTSANSTATPFQVLQGSLTGTLAVPLAQFVSTWNNAGLAATGVLISITNTSSAAASFPFLIQVSGATQFSVDKAGNVAHAGTLTATAVPLSGITAATAAVNLITNGNNISTWQWFLTSDANAAFKLGENGAATGGTLTGGLANQQILSVFTMTNSTAAPFNVTQGSITNTVATPAAQIQCTWNNAGLTGLCMLISVTSTSSAAGSLPFQILVGGASQFSVDKVGNAKAASSVSAGSGPPTACGPATGCLALGEASTAGTPTAGQTYIRANSNHTITVSINGGAETALTALSTLTGATASNTIANGNFPQTWNCAMTTDAQDCMLFGETSAATGGTLTGGLANQAILAVSTATNSTAAALEVVQGSITNTVATPIAQFEGTWNNGSLVGRGVLVSITNTASAAGSFPFQVLVGGTSEFSVDKAGAGIFATSVATGTAPTVTAGTAGLFAATEGTAPTGSASTDLWYANSTNHCASINNNNADVGCAAAFNEINAFAPTLRTSGAAAYMSLTIPADTGITAATEGPGFLTITATRTWATTGTVATQREFLFVAPTYASASASQTFTKAATLAINAAPIAGTNAIITNAYALWVQAGNAQFDGGLTPSQTIGIIGTTTNNNANTGSVGEYVTATIATGSSVSLTTATTANITSVSLTAGDWDVWGVVDYTAGATTSITNLRQGISTTSATLGAQDTFTSFSVAAEVPTAAIDAAWATPTVRLSLSGTTTVFLVSNGTFTVSTLKGYGSIFARRRR